MSRHIRKTIAGAVLGATAVAPGGAQAEDVHLLSPGVVFSAHDGVSGRRNGIGLETTYLSFGRYYDERSWYPAAFFQLEFFGDGAVRVAFGHQFTGSGIGAETGIAMEFGPEDDFDVRLHLAPYVGLGVVNLAGRFMPGLDGIDVGGALTLKAPLDLGRGELYDPFEATVVDGRPVRDLAGACFRPRVVAIGRRALPDAARRLPRRVRRALGRAWLDAARDEHGSITAFRRLAAQLEAHGAPSALVARARRSAADEDRHARQCFAIAGALLGLRLRPVAASVPLGPMPDRVDLAVESVVDGEWNEGAAAALARRGADAATVGPVRDTLTTIAVDEAGHAALARSVREWAEGAASPAERRRIRRRIAHARAERAPVSPRHRAPRGAEAHWARWGRPIAAHVVEVEREMRQV